MPGDVPAASQSIATAIEAKNRHIRAFADGRHADPTDEQIKQLSL
jgi:hypothetical protein